MKSFRHIQIPSHSPNFADYGDKQYYLMPFDASINVGDTILFTEHDHAGLFTTVFIGDIFHIDVSSCGEKMLLVLEEHNEAKELLAKIRNVEKRETINRKERFLKEKCMAKYVV